METDTCIVKKMFVILEFFLKKSNAMNIVPNCYVNSFLPATHYVEVSLQAKRAPPCDFEAVTLDIFEVLLFNYKLKSQIMEPVTLHFTCVILSEFIDQLQKLSKECDGYRYLYSLQHLTQDNVKPDTIKCPTQLESDPDKGHETSEQANDIVLTDVNPSSCNKEEKLDSKYTVNVASIAPSETSTILLQVNGKPGGSKKNVTTNSNKNKRSITTKKLPSQTVVNVKTKCEFCNRKFISSAKFSIHLARFHGNKVNLTADNQSFKCDQCDCQFSSEDSLIEHIKTHEECKSLVPVESPVVTGCTTEPEPPEQCPPPLSLENLPFFSCRTCHITYKTFDLFNAHKCIKTGLSWMTYDEMVDRPQLVSTIETLKSFKKFRCGTCHEEYRQFNRMMYHLSRCISGPYTCEICGQEYLYKNCLNIHKKENHKNVNSFFCEECGLGFKFFTSLQKHLVKRHETEQGPYFCDICSKAFPKKIFLTNHNIQVHKIEKKFLCQVCGKTLSNPNSLSAHITTHTDSRKFACTVCNKTFRQKEKHKYHMRTHTGERPHLCQTCGKSFIRKSRLDDHMRRHRGEKRYQCQFCNKAYAGAYDLKQHQKKLHIDSEVLTAALSQPSQNIDDPGEDENINEASQSDGKENVDSKSTVNVLTVQNSSEKLAVIQDTKNITILPATEQTTVHGVHNSEQLPQIHSLQTSDAKTVLQLNSVQLENHPVVFRKPLNDPDISKILVHLNNSQNSNPLQLVQALNTGDSNSKIFIQIDPRSVQNDTAISDNLVNNTSKMLVHLNQSADIRSNNVFTISDGIHLAPLPNNSPNPVAQYVQVVAQSAGNSSGCNSSLPIHLQLPLQVVQNAQSTSYEIQPVNMSNNSAVFFTTPAAGFEVSNVSY